MLVPVVACAKGGNQTYSEKVWNCFDCTLFFIYRVRTEVEAGERPCKGCGLMGLVSICVSGMCVSNAGV